MNNEKNIVIVYCILILISIQSCNRSTEEIERPEKIVSKRQTVYHLETYQNLSTMWYKYYQEFPSEDAYANWMYAARYAQDPKYKSLLAKGVKKYPGNPTLLYLSGNLKHGKKDNLEGQHLLEQAVRLDPTYLDPWFSLVIHYMNREPEKTNYALRKLLEGGAVAEEIMDYNYNLLSLLDKNAIIFTNGDNDTYPGWILQRILNYRPDVNIVNRSLLNTDWYPITIMKDGVPKFITQDGLMEIRATILNKIKTEKMAIPSGGPFSDTLIVRIIEAASQEKRPVYFSATLTQSNVIKRYRKTGHNLGLVTFVTATNTPYSDLLENLMDIWITKFRTGGLDSWRLRYAEEANAGRRIMQNYTASLISLIDTIAKYTPEHQLDLFRWYQNHLLNITSSKLGEKMNKEWCRIADIEEIRNWCTDQGYLE